VFNLYFRYWHELGIHGDCPYRFTQAELRIHSVDADGWNEVQDFFDSIEGLSKGMAGQVLKRSTLPLGSSQD
jgi:hypothetical protein